MSRLTLGIDLGGTKMLMLAEGAGERSTAEVATGPRFDARGFQAAIAGFLADLPEAPACVGIAVPGLVSQSRPEDGPENQTEDQRIVSCDVLPLLVGLRPRELCALPCPVLFVNDAEAALIDEVAGSPGHGTLAVVLVGTGIGMSFQSDGIRWRGANGWSGELGSIPIAVRDQVLTLDAAASGAALLLRAGCDAGALSLRLAEQDPGALELVRSAGLALGLGLATVINLLDPDLLCLGGGTLGFPGYREAALESAQRHALPELWRQCSIRPPRDGRLAPALGAMRLAAAKMSGA